MSAPGAPRHMPLLASSKASTSTRDDVNRGGARRCSFSRRQYAAPDLVLLDRLKQSAEIALAEAFVALALDEFEEDRADRIGREDLQQNLGLAAIDDAFAIDKDAVALQAAEILAMAGQPRVYFFIIGRRRRRHEGQSVAAQPLDSFVNVAAAAGDMLDAFAIIGVQIFLDLAFFVSR